MKPVSLAAVGLRLRVQVLHASPALLAAAALALGVAGALAWNVHALWALEAEQDRFAAAAKAARLAALHAADPRAGPGAVPKPAAPAPAADNLVAFYGALGEQRYAERQVKTLFGLAAKAGLVLRQGEYKSAYDRNAGLHTYQVNLPVKGSYAAIWQFAMAALRAVPFASLDDISFRRDAIGDADVEARLRLTFYLRDSATTS